MINPGKLVVQAPRFTPFVKNRGKLPDKNKDHWTMPHESQHTNHTLTDRPTRGRKSQTYS